MRQFFAVFIVALLLTGCGLRPPEELSMPALEGEYAEHRIQRLWARNTGSGVRKVHLELTPAVTSDSVYVADHRGRVHARERDSGSRQWRVSTDDRIGTGLYAGYGMVIYGTRDGEAVALDAEDGSEQWRATIGSELFSRPAAGSGLVVFQTMDGRVVALERDDGEERWSHDTSLPILILRAGATPVISGNRVFAGFANGRAVALDADSGAPVWERRVAEPSGRSELERLVDVTGDLILQGNALYAGTFQGNVMRMDRDSGQPMWERAMSVHAPLAHDGRNLYVADSDGNVLALDQRTGSPLWRQDRLSERGGLTGVVAHDGHVVTGDSEGWLHWLDAESGRLLMRRQHQPQGFAATPVERDGVLYVLGRRGWLAAYELHER